MSKEIKEILNDLKNTGYEKLAKNIENIIDYITKLEQSCCEYKCICNEHQVNCILETLHYMEKENKRLNNIINELEKLLIKRINDVPETMAEAYEDEFILDNLKQLKEVI